MDNLWIDQKSIHFFGGFVHIVFKKPFICGIFKVDFFIHIILPHFPPILDLWKPPGLLSTIIHLIHSNFLIIHILFPKISRIFHCENPIFIVIYKKDIYLQSQTGVIIILMGRKKWTLLLKKWEEILQTVKSEYEVTDVPF